MQWVRLDICIQTCCLSGGLTVISVIQFYNFFSESKKLPGIRLSPDTPSAGQLGTDKTLDAIRQLHTGQYYLITPDDT